MSFTISHTQTHTHASMKSIYHRKTHALYAVHTHTLLLDLSFCRTDKTAIRQKNKIVQLVMFFKLNC